MNILLTFIGSKDPYHYSRNGEREDGPVLSVVKGYGISFERIYCYCTPQLKNNGEKMSQAFLEEGISGYCEIIELGLEDPTNYEDILFLLRDQVAILRENYRGAWFYISPSSGTPEMHASWLFLHGSGELPSRIIHARPPRYVTAEMKQFDEYDLTAQYFPTIRFPFASHNDKRKSWDLQTLLAKVGLVGQHPLFTKTVDMARRLAATDYPVLLVGETGTGKELFARFIHGASSRSVKPFRPTNIAALSSELISSELFGHKKGAFSGAVQDKKGLIQEAGGGTVFLDELAEIPKEDQAKLLRFLESGEIQPVGSSQTEIARARIVAATNRKVIDEQDESLREDIYYRFEIGLLSLPSLKERKDDIPLIANTIVDSFNEAGESDRRLSPEALVYLENLPWPGNVRQLASVLKRSFLQSDNEILGIEDIFYQGPETSAQAKSQEESIETFYLPEFDQGFELKNYIRDLRAQVITKALAQSDGNQKKAAELLGLSPAALSKALRQKYKEATKDNMNR